MRTAKLLELEEILQNLAPALGENTFRMELNSPDGIQLVLYAHDFSFLGLGSNLQAVGQGIALDDQRMIAGCRERVGHTFEQSFAVMFNWGSLAVHHSVIDDYIAAEHMPDALMAQANTQGRNVAAE